MPSLTGYIGINGQLHPTGPDAGGGPIVGGTPNLIATNCCTGKGDKIPRYLQGTLTTALGETNCDCVRGGFPGGQIVILEYNPMAGTLISGVWIGVIRNPDNCFNGARIELYCDDISEDPPYNPTNMVADLNGPCFDQQALFTNAIDNPNNTCLAQFNWLFTVTDVMPCCDNPLAAVSLDLTIEPI